MSWVWRSLWLALTSVLDVGGLAHLYIVPEDGIREPVSQQLHDLRLELYKERAQYQATRHQGSAWALPLGETLTKNCVPQVRHREQLQGPPVREGTTCHLEGSEFTSGWRSLVPSTQLPVLPAMTWGMDMTDLPGF